MATQAEVRELIAYIRRTGYKVTKSGTKHYKVLTPKGAVAVDENGPLIISATPSETRWRQMTVNRLMKAGVFTIDPYKKTPTGGDGDAADDQPKKTKEDERKQRERAAVARTARERSDENKLRTRALRSRVERLIVKLGGWGSGPGISTSGISVRDFTRVMYHWSQTYARSVWPRDSFGRDATIEAASQAVALLRKADSTIGGRWLPALEGFMDAVEFGAGDPPDYEAAAKRYLDLSREVKGLKPAGTTRTPTRTPRSTPAPEPPPAPEPREDEPTAERIGPLYAALVPTVPELALEVLYEMAAANHDQADRGRILDLARRVAEAELNNPTTTTKTGRSS